MDFEARPQWRSIFVDQPHFDGSPLPPFYAGMTVAEMLTNTPPVTNAISLAPSACTNLDDSPELRRHPILDQFVSDMGNDPIALANYVLNEIDLTDWMDYNDDGNVSEQSINLGGVSRGAHWHVPGEARLARRAVRPAGLSAAPGRRAGHLCLSAAQRPANPGRAPLAGCSSSRCMAGSARRASLTTPTP